MLRTHTKKSAKTGKNYENYENCQNKPKLPKPTKKTPKKNHNRGEALTHTNLQHTHTDPTLHKGTAPMPNKKKKAKITPAPYLVESAFSDSMQPEQKKLANTTLSLLEKNGMVILVGKVDVPGCAKTVVAGSVAHSYMANQVNHSPPPRHRHHATATSSLKRCVSVHSALRSLSPLSPAL